MGDLLHLMYDIALKMVLGIMLVQRRPIKGARAYEVHIHTKYKPFDQTIFSGSDATRTVSKLKVMVRERTMELAKIRSMEVVSENHEYDALPPAPAPPEQDLQTQSETLPLEAVEVSEKPEHTQDRSETDV